MEDPSEIEALAQRVCDALTAHARAARAGEHAPEQFVPLMAAVMEAARSYAQLTEALTGWGSPFAFHLDDEDDDAAWECEHGPPPEDEIAARVSVRARWDFVVRDPERWASWVARQDFAEADATCVDLDTSTGPFFALFERDGWDTTPYESEGVEFAGSGFVVETVNTTLYEMDSDE
ncbi:MAG: hypothetical protein ACT4QG_20040 [Sporichthyaceae bacterium]